MCTEHLGASVGARRSMPGLRIHNRFLSASLSSPFSLESAALKHSSAFNLITSNGTTEGMRPDNYAAVQLLSSALKATNIYLKHYHSEFCHHPWVYLSFLCHHLHAMQFRSFHSDPLCPSIPWSIAAKVPHSKVHCLIDSINSRMSQKRQT